MDSMRHLSTSLPPTSRRRQDQPELLADFKAAALSVTNLYKTAAASQEKLRAGGYQDALDDLLAFLDRENLGLMDGEGWRVRQWATERLVDDQGQQKAPGSDEDDESASTAADRQRVSPEVQSKPPINMPVSSSELAEEPSPRRIATSEPPQRARSQTPAAASPQQPATHFISVPVADDFTFRSAHNYPTNHDRDASGMEIDNTTNTTASTPSSTESVRFIPRASIRGRNQPRHRGGTTGTPTFNLNLGVGASNKRKLPYPDFFDISGLGGNFEGQDRKEGGSGRGGGKRSRHV